MTPDELLQRGVAHHQRGELAQAEELYRQALAQMPQDADALHLLGLVRLGQGRGAGEAAELIRRATEANPKVAGYQLSLGRALLAVDQPSQACEALLRAIALEPGLGDAYTSLGFVQERLGRAAEARASFLRAIELNPRDVVAMDRVGLSFLLERRFEDAAALLRQAVKLAPSFADAHKHLGGVLIELNDPTGAEAALRAAVRLQPRDPEAHYNLGMVLHRMRRYAEAIAPYRSAVALEPGYVEALNNLGMILYQGKQYAEALSCHQRAAQLRPGHGNARCNLALDYSTLGMMGEAIGEYRAALALNPADAPTHSALLLAMSYHDGCTLEEIDKEFGEWGRRHAAGFSMGAPKHDNERDPDRRLRIGYLSGDLRQHPVGRFMEPLIEKLDRRQFEIFCYANGEDRDALADRLKALADHWRNVGPMSDDELAQQVRSDRIDILIDLSGHTGDTRLLAMARKPAPVQATYLGFPSTTGMSRMDWRITDMLADPPGMTERFGTEKLARLPETSVCFRAPEAADVGPLPAGRNGYVTFGSFNNLAKLSASTMRLWGIILRQTAGSRLLLKHAALGDPGVCELMRQRLSQAQAPVEQVELVGRQTSETEHLAMYAQVDVALDPIPYNGTTTTCEALWMGAPVVALEGKNALGRASLSILKNIGLGQLVGSDEDGYVRIAAQLAGNIEALAGMRAAMRQRMLSSPLMDEAKFAREMGGIYRRMWHAWCAQGQGS